MCFPSSGFTGVRLSVAYAFVGAVSFLGFDFFPSKTSVGLDLWIGIVEIWFCHRISCFLQ